MAQPRIRDFVTFLTTLPASVMITVCLFLPHAKRCNNGELQTPLASGHWLVIVPVALIGVLPVAWRAWPPIRRRVPEVMLAFAMIGLALLVITIPVAIYLMWGYAKRQFRGELLAAMCSAALVMLWLLFFPVTMLFDKWLPPAELTWGAGVVMLVGLFVWTSAAIARPVNVDEARSLQRAQAPLDSSCACKRDARGAYWGRRPRTTCECKPSHSSPPSDALMSSTGSARRLAENARRTQMSRSPGDRDSLAP